MEKIIFDAALEACKGRRRAQNVLLSLRDVLEAQGIELELYEWPVWPHSGYGDGRYRWTLSPGEYRHLWSDLPWALFRRLSLDGYSEYSSLETAWVAFFAALLEPSNSS